LRSRVRGESAGASLGRGRSVGSPGGRLEVTNMMQGQQNCDVVDFEVQASWASALREHGDEPTFTQSQLRSEKTCGMVACGQKCSGQVAAVTLHCVRARVNTPVVVRTKIEARFAGGHLRHNVARGHRRNDDVIDTMSCWRIYA
jgi:hypothetical protein